MRHHQDLKSKKWYKNKEAASFGSSLFAGLTGPDIYRDLSASDHYTACLCNAVCNDGTSICSLLKVIHIYLKNI